MSDVKMSEAERLANMLELCHKNNTLETLAAAELRRLAAEVEALAARSAAEARWYCLDRDGVAMLCKDEADARAQVIESDDCWPGRAPHRAALLGDVRALHAELRHARDGLTKGRSRMREDNERLVREAHTWSKAAEAYAKQAQRTPLDPVDVEELWDKANADDAADEVHHAFARLLERAHGIGPNVL